jgi:hypothetical protein
MVAKGNGKAALTAVRKRPKAPEPPADLQAAGAGIWALVWSLPQVLYPSDLLAVSRLAHLEDQAAALRAQVLEQGVTLTRPVQNSRGELLGSETVTHPGLLALRRIGSEAGELCSVLGLTPSARASLGLVVSQPEPNSLDLLRARRDRRRAAAKGRAQAERAKGEG